MIPFVACLPTISKPFLKRTISLWSTSEDDTVRVIAFLCILRYAASDLSANLHTVLKVSKNLQIKLAVTVCNFGK